MIVFIVNTAHVAIKMFAVDAHERQIILPLAVGPNRVVCFGQSGHLHPLVNTPTKVFLKMFVKKMSKWRKETRQNREREQFWTDWGIP